MTEAEIAAAREVELAKARELAEVYSECQKNLNIDTARAVIAINKGYTDAELAKITGIDPDTLARLVALLNELDDDPSKEGLEKIEALIDKATSALEKVIQLELRVTDQGKLIDNAAAIGKDNTARIEELEKNGGGGHAECGDCFDMLKDAVADECSKTRTELGTSLSQLSVELIGSDVTVNAPVATEAAAAGEGEAAPQGGDGAAL